MLLVVLLAVTLGDQWDPLRMAIDNYADIDNMVALIADECNDNSAPLFQHIKGSSSFDQSISFASASKWITATAIMRLVEAGTMSLSDTPSEYIPWWTSDSSDARSRITLADLLSFTSGLVAGDGSKDTDANHYCVGNRSWEPEPCAQALYASVPTLPAEPGTLYCYGSNHMHVAGLMASKATGKDWKTIFDEEIATPSGMTIAALHNIWTPVSNPLHAGGFFGKPAEYLKFLRAYFMGSLLSPASMALMEQDYTASPVTFGSSPYATFGLPAHYALGHWIECAPGTDPFDPIACEPHHASPGRFGFYPFVNRAKRIYGVFGGQDLIRLIPSYYSTDLGQTLQAMTNASTCPISTTTGATSTSGTTTSSTTSGTTTSNATSGTTASSTTSGTTTSNTTSGTATSSTTSGTATSSTGATTSTGSTTSSASTTSTASTSSGTSTSATSSSGISSGGTSSAATTSLSFAYSLLPSITIVGLCAFAAAGVP